MAGRGKQNVDFVFAFVLFYVCLFICTLVSFSLHSPTIFHNFKIKNRFKWLVLQRLLCGFHMSGRNIKVFSLSLFQRSEEHLFIFVFGIFCVLHVLFFCFELVSFLKLTLFFPMEMFWTIEVCLPLTFKVIKRKSFVAQLWQQTQ